MANGFETVEHWSARNFGQAFTQYLVAPALQGIYAGDLKQLSAHLVVNQVLNRKRQKKKSSANLVSAPNGMGYIMQQLERKLIANGVVIQYSTLWTPELPSDHLVIATSLGEAIPILKKLKQDHNAQALEKIEMLPLVSATCFFKQKPMNYIGFGILFPRDQSIRALGLLMNDVIYDRKAELHSETYIFGGAFDPDILQLTDDELRMQIQKDRNRIFKSQDLISEMVVTRWPKALPHYTVEFEKCLNLLKPMLNTKLHGNYLGQIGLSRILEKSESLAEELAKAGQV